MPAPAYSCNFHDAIGCAGAGREDLDYEQHVGRRYPWRALSGYVGKKPCIDGDLDLEKNLEVGGQRICQKPGEAQRYPLVQRVWTRRHDRGPLAEFPAARRVEFDRVPLVEGSTGRAAVLWARA